MLSVVCTRPTLAQVDSAADAWERRDLVESERLYGGRLANDSSDAEALFRMGLLLAWTDRRAEAEALLDRLLELVPGHVDAAVARARVLAWEGELEAAATSLDTILHDHPNHLGALELRAQVAVWAGREQEAHDAYAALYDRAPRGSASSRQAQLGSARVLARAGQLDSALAVYDLLLEADATDLEALRGSARTTAWTGRLPDAERLWRQAVALDTSNAASRIGLSQTLRWQGRTTEAEAVLDPVSDQVADDAALRREDQEIHAMTAPRFLAAVVRESDSDGNGMTTMRLRGRWPAFTGLTLAFDGYLRRAGWDVGFPDRGSVGAIAPQRGRCGSSGWGPGDWVSAGPTGRRIACSSISSPASPARHGARTAAR